MQVFGMVSCYFRVQNGIINCLMDYFQFINYKICITKCVASDLNYVKCELNYIQLENIWLFPADDGKIQRNGETTMPIN